MIIETSRAMWAKWLCESFNVIAVSGTKFQNYLENRDSYFKLCAILVEHG